MSCNVMTTLQKSYVVVAGGKHSFKFTALKSTEILDLQRMVWLVGPEMPMAVYDSQMVQCVEGGVLLIGGADVNGSAFSEMFHLPTKEGPWYELPKKLSVARKNHIAITLPTSFETNQQN